MLIFCSFVHNATFHCKYRATSWLLLLWFSLTNEFHLTSATWPVARAQHMICHHVVCPQYEFSPSYIQAVLEHDLLEQNINNYNDKVATGNFSPGPFAHLQDTFAKHISSFYSLLPLKTESNFLHMTTNVISREPVWVCQCDITDQPQSAHKSPRRWCNQWQATKLTRSERAEWSEHSFRHHQLHGV